MVLAGSPRGAGRRQRLVAYAVLVALLGLGVSQLVGHAWVRERPYVHHVAHLLLPPSPDPSFPSDHAVGAFALAAPFVLARRRLGWWLLGVAVLQSLLRVVVGTHYPSDVAGGAFLGAVAGAAVWRCRSCLERPLAIGLAGARRCRLA